GAGPAAHLAHNSADQADRLSRYLETADLETLLHDAETFARRQPLAVAGLGFALGVVGARILKAGGGRRYRLYGDRPTYTR
ncbi:MAG: hypothetical protein JO349_02285, partial [Candidatus Eremiobacteraeota bacterium]|nr:hypothetical protein [Candidatus Eremiobacteraeota bacterium]